MGIRSLKNDARLEFLGGVVARAVAAVRAHVRGSAAGKRAAVRDCMQRGRGAGPSRPSSPPDLGVGEGHRCKGTWQGSVYVFRSRGKRRRAT